MELPDAVPVMTLPSATLFPQALLPLYIFEPRYRQMLADMLKSDRMFSVAMQKPGNKRESPCPRWRCLVGTHKSRSLGFA